MSYSKPGYKIYNFFLSILAGKFDYNNCFRNVQIFNKFWSENPKIFNKLVAINGDVASADLALSDESKQTLIDEVTVVFHVAATLKLDANLKDAVNMNTEGTLRLLKLSCEMKNLVVSTI